MNRNDRFLKSIVPLLICMFVLSTTVFYKNHKSSEQANYLLKEYYLPISSRINSVLFDVVELSRFLQSLNENAINGIVVNDKASSIKLLRILSASNEKILQIVQLIERLKFENTEKFPLEILLDLKQKMAVLKNYIKANEDLDIKYLIASLDTITSRIEQTSYTVSRSLNLFYEKAYKIEALDRIYSTGLIAFFMMVYLPVMILLTRRIRISLRNEEQSKLELNASMKKLKVQALHDPLTGLANRALFYERFEQQLKHQKRTGSQCCVLYMDLDKFKCINDTKGHEEGDKVLVHVSKCMLSSVREMDTVSRFGGDEFVILLLDIESRASIERIAQKILYRIGEPIEWKDESFCISASIGVHVVDDADLENIEDIDAILRKADDALFYQKEHGRDGFSFYSQEMNKYDGPHKLRLA